MNKIFSARNIVGLILFILTGILAALPKKRPPITLSRNTPMTTCRSDANDC